MPDNVKTALSLSLLRLLKPLVKIMLREGLTYSHFAAIAQMAFVESAAKDFVGKGMKSTASSVCALTGMTPQEVKAVLIDGNFVKDNLGSVERVLTFAGMDLVPEARSAMDRYNAERPRYAHGRIAYRLQDFGIDAAERRAAFSAFPELCAV